MCRFVAYFSKKKILLDELLTKPENSLIKQSHKALEGVNSINADGFGIAWYNKDLSNTPGLFKSIQPAWNDLNLIHLSQHINSNCFLAHIRASTIGEVTKNNCHPFSYKDYSLVHNGTIRDFSKYKKKIINIIDEELFLNIKGNTDSEYFFFLIMHFINQNYDLQKAVKKSISLIENLQMDDDSFSRINIVITNGKELVATRFSSKNQSNLSLKYSIEESDANKLSSLIISSEALDTNKRVWEELPDKHYLYVKQDKMKIEIFKL